VIPENFKIVINLSNRDIFTFLQGHILFEGVEIFYFPRIQEIDQIIQRIQPQIVLLQFDSEFLNNERIVQFLKSPQQDHVWKIFVLGSDVHPEDLKRIQDIKKILLCYDANQLEVITYNIKSLLKQEKKFIEEKQTQIFTDNLFKCSKIIQQNKSIPEIFETLTNFLPKILDFDYWAFCSFDPEFNRIVYSKQFIPPQRRNYAILTPSIEKLAEVWIKKMDRFHVSATEDPQLFRKLKEWGWDVKQIDFYPFTTDGLPLGGLILGKIKLKDYPKLYDKFLKEISELLSRNIYHYIYKEKIEKSHSGFAEQLIYNRFSEDAILQLSCKKINEVAKAESTIFWQVNRGFGFIFPKYSYSRENQAKWRALEKNIIFLNKDHYLSHLITRDKPFLFSIDHANGELSEVTIQTFQKLGYYYLLVAPVRVQNEEIGIFVSNRTKADSDFSMWELNQVSELLDRIQKVMEDTHVVKEANIKLKQLSRIFELGNELKLDLNLDDILSHILNSIRKTLGWNDVAVLRSNKFQKKYQLVRKVGFDSHVQLPIDFLKEVSFDAFKKFLLNCKKISDSYFYNSHPLTVNNGSRELFTEVLTEWYDEDLLIVPIETRKNLLGFIIVRDPVDRLKPTEDRVISLEYFANQAAVAIENSVLFENLIASEERYRSLAETMTLGLVTCSPEGRIIYVNPAFQNLVGLDKKSLLNQNLTNFYSPGSQTKLHQIIELLMNKEKKRSTHVENEELELISTAGETIPVSTFAFPFYQQRQKIGFFLVHNDLRPIKKLERLKSDFNSMIVHDLRSPMNVIQGFIELIRTRVVGDINAEQEELLDIAKENVKKFLTLIDNFLVASKMEVGKFSIDPKVSELHPLIERIVENHRVLLKNKNITLECQLNPNLPLLFFDSLRIEQMLNNLLSNAIKFTPEGGKVWITTDFYQKKIKGEEKMFARIGVHDTGPGIPPERIDHVFEKYEQVDSGSSLKSSGTGLGLAICKEIANLHGGEIWVESEMNKGSHFYFTLPIEPSIDKLLK